MPPDIKQYFRDKYKNQIEEMDCDLKGTPNGPNGRLSLKGHIDVKKQSDIVGSGDSRIKAIAESFIQEEAEVLGLADLTEWQPSPVHYEGRGYAIISYHRNIQNLPFGVCDLGGCHPEIRLQIDRNDEILWFFAQLDPVTPEVYKAVSRKMILEDDAAKIVERDLQKEGMHVPITKLTKSVIPTPPYVIWQTGFMKNGYGWHYEINAVTGDIVKRSKGLIRDE